MNIKCLRIQFKTLFRRPPQVKSSKSQIHAKFYKIPTIRFEDQQLTSFSGLLIFQVLFAKLNSQSLKRLQQLGPLRRPQKQRRSQKLLRHLLLKRYRKNRQKRGLCQSKQTLPVSFIESLARRSRLLSKWATRSKKTPLFVCLK